MERLLDLAVFFLPLLVGFVLGAFWGIGAGYREHQRRQAEASTWADRFSDN